MNNIYIGIEKKILLLIDIFNDKRFENLLENKQNKLITEVIDYYENLIPTKKRIYGITGIIEFLRQKIMMKGGVNYNKFTVKELRILVKEKKMSIRKRDGSGYNTKSQLIRKLKKSNKKK